MNLKFINYSLLSLGVISCAGGSPEDKEPKKNVLFIVVDDLNNTLGCYDHPVVQTPNIDKLAQNGIQFNHAYCNYAVSGPSRSSFLTSLRPESINVLDNRTPLQDVLDGRITMPYLFKQNGYYTMSIGKVFHRAGEYDDEKAWDEIHKFKATELGKQGVGRNMTDDKLKWCNWKITEGGDMDQQDGQNAAKAIEFIKSDHDKPFFLALGFAKPHDPFHAPKKYFDLYSLEDCDPPELPEGWTPPYSHTLPGETKTFNKFTDQDKREFLRSYYACTSFMDAQLGKVIDALEEEGLAENTIIVFFGDHGYHLGEHNWWNKVTIYEKGHNAPLIIVPTEGDVAGTKTDAMMEFIDFYPTLADVCELENIPDYLEGESFKKVLENPELPFREFTNVIVRRNGMIGRSVKTKEWRYTIWDEGNKGEELYNELEDKLEYNNLANDSKYDDIKKQMKELIVY
ncbi:MAG: sulfatase [Bacteroidales bacterium]|nr:sulfatase [Bacteroidales bacterium]